MVEANLQTRRRSRRVPLQLAVFVRVLAVGRESRQVQAFTSSVNAHGGLLVASLAVAANQRFALVNPKTGQTVGCRVVRVETSPDGFAIAFEFDQQNARFWPITFPPQDWDVNEPLSP